MKIYCEAFNHWLYNPVDTSLLCENRAKKLGISECQKCKGFHVSKSMAASKRDLIPKMIPLNVDRSEWIEAVRGLQAEYQIQEGTKQDETSSRRIAILLGELYLTQGGVLINVPIVEKDLFDLSMEYCVGYDPLDHEERFKGKDKKKVLLTWGVDRVSGMEGYTTQLKEWSAVALLVKPEKEEGDGELSITRNDHGRGVDETPWHEERRIEIFAGRERDALRRVEQETPRLP